MGIVGTPLQTVDYKGPTPDPLIQPFIDTLYREVFDQHEPDAEVDVLVVHDTETRTALDYRVFRVHGPDDEGSGSDYESAEDMFRAMTAWGYSFGEDTQYVWFHKHPEGHPEPGIKDFYGVIAMLGLDYVAGTPNERGNMPRRYRFMVVTNRLEHPSFQPFADALPLGPYPAINREVRAKRHAITLSIFGADSEMYQVEQELFDLTDYLDRLTEEQGEDFDLDDYPEEVERGKTLMRRYNEVLSGLAEADRRAHPELYQDEDDDEPDALLAQMLERIQNALAGIAGVDVEVVRGDATPDEPAKPVRRTFGPPPEPKPEATPAPQVTPPTPIDDLPAFDPRLLEGIDFGDLSFLD